MPEHLEYFRFIGRVVAVAVFHQKFMDAFVGSFYKTNFRNEMPL